MILWERQTLQNDQWYYVKIGPLAGWLKKDGTRCTYGFRYIGSDEYSRECLFVETTLIPENVVFSQVFVEKSVSEVLFRPALPDRSVVVNFGGPVKLLPGSEMVIYVSLPLWLQGTVDGSKLLFDVPTTILPDTWFGAPTGGRLGYALNGSFSWKREEVFPLPNAVVCPFRIRNASRVDYSPSRAVILAPDLPVYMKVLDREDGEEPEALLITPEAVAEFHGNDEVDLQITGRLPDYLSGAKPLSEPRAAEENILGKGLVLLKKISNM